MRTCVFFFAMLLSTAACDLFNPQGGGGSGGGTGGTAEGGAGGGAGGGVDDTCAKKGACDACRSCAAAGPCKTQTDDCLADPTCVGIDECLALCGSTPEDCWETCRAQNPTGIELYDAARGCLDCVYCEDACAIALVCGG